MKKNYKFKGVVFDFDGVLGDTEILQYKKWNILLKPFGIFISEEEYIKEYCGKSSSTEIPKLLKQKYPQIKMSEKEIAENAAKILKDLFKKEAKLMPNSLDAIKFFKENGFKIAICSGKNQEELEMKLSSVGLSDFFSKEHRVTESDAGFAKPHPAMYELAVKKLGLKPNECIAFEDTYAGIASAKGAGLFVIALPNKFTINQDLSKADIVIKGGWPELLKDPFSFLSKFF